MKNKKTISFIVLLIGILLLSISMYMIKDAQSRLVPGLMLLGAVLIISGSAKVITNELILKRYLEKKKIMNSKADDVTENDIKHKASNKANLLVTIFLFIVIILTFILEMNYFILSLIIVVSIFLQSSIYAIYYIYYDKKLKD